MSARVMALRSPRLSTSLALTALLAAAGCSAIVSPDPSRLGGGGMDAGPGETDTGPRPDTGPVDAWAPDAWRADPPDAGTDAGPTCPPSCADEHACTTDRCVDGACVHEPDDALCPGGRCSVEMGCVPTICTTNEECQDGDRCNGAERCDPAAGTEDGCVAAAAPLDCNDGVSCTDDHCAPDRGCFHDRFDDRCNDGIACTADVCTGTAGPTGCEFRGNDMLCNTGCTMGARCTPAGCMGGAPRVCMDDGNPCTVERCDAAGGACVADALDADMDGHPAMTATAGGTTMRCGGTDCDDTRAAVNPRATEMCGNGLDDDCNPATPDVCAGPTGDTCATARPLTLAGGTGTATFTPSMFRPDYTTTCGGSGNDAVFYFDVTGVVDVRIETAGAVDTVLATATTCDATAFRDRCNDDRDPDSVTTSRIWLRRVGTAGMTTRVYVLVDEFSGSDPDTATLTVSVSGASPDVCPTTTGPRPLDVSGGGVVLGRIAPAVGPIPSGMRGSCQSPTSMTPEAMFRIDEPDRNLNRLEAVTTGFVPDLYVKPGGCAAPAAMEIRCVNGSGSGGGGTAVIEDATSGNTSTVFYAFLDNAPAAGGEYRFTFDP